VGGCCRGIEKKNRRHRDKESEKNRIIGYVLESTYFTLSRVMTHLICVTWLFHLCDMPHSNVWRDSFILVLKSSAPRRGSWLISFNVWHVAFIRVTWLFLMCRTWRIHTCDMNHSSCVRERVTVRVAVCVAVRVAVCCDMNHSSWRRIHCPLFGGMTQFMSVTLLFQVHDMTYSYVRHDSFILANINESYHAYEPCNTHEPNIIYIWVMSRIWMRHATHLKESCHTHDTHTYILLVSWVLHDSYAWYDSLILAHMNESCCTYEWVMSHPWHSYKPANITTIHDSFIMAWLNHIHEPLCMPMYSYEPI